MSFRRTAGIIIRVTDYGESDKIVTLYCPTEGKLTLLAKGAKRSTKRFVNKLELFSHLDIQYNSRYALALLDQADLVNGFPRLRQNFKRYAACQLLCELMLHWTSENDGDPNLFAAFLASLATLHNGGPMRKTLVLFLIHLYSQLGYQPNLSACAQCGKLDADSGPFHFRRSLGTIICQRCSPSPSTAQGCRLSINTIKLIAQAQRMPFAKTGRLQFPSLAMTQILQLFQAYGSYLLDRKINAWEFIDCHED